MRPSRRTSLPAMMSGGTRRRDPHVFCQRADPETMMPQRRMIVAANMPEERGGGSPTLPPSTSLAPEVSTPLPPGPSGLRVVVPVLSTSAGRAAACRNLCRCLRRSFRVVTVADGVGLTANGDRSPRPQVQTPRRPQGNRGRKHSTLAARSFSPPVPTTGLVLVKQARVLGISHSVT